MNRPVYEFFIDPKKKNAGVKAISLVDEPAIQSDFVLFAKDTKTERYVFGNEEKNMILGLALVPNKKIFRVDKSGKEFDGWFSASTIEMIRNKFMEEKNTDQVNLQHNDSEYVKGVYLVETYIVQSPEQQKHLLSKGIDAPIGSWACQYHVESPELFAEIKQGGYHGFSVEAFLDNQLTIQTPTIMNKFIEKFKALLNELETTENFTEGRIAETGQQITYGKPGEPVKAVVDIKAGGNQSVSSLSDGQYTLEDGTIIAVKGGVLFETEPKLESETDYKVPTPDQIIEQHTAAEQNLLIMSDTKHDAANAYEPTGSKPKEYKPVAPPAAQTMENDTTPTGVANNGSGLKVDPVKSIGEVPKKKKLKTTKMKMKELSDKLLPATPVSADGGKPTVPDTVSKTEKIKEVPATPTKFTKEEWQKLSRYEKLKLQLNLAKEPASTPAVEKEPVKPLVGLCDNKLAVDPNESQPTDKVPEGKVPEAPVAPKEPIAPKEPVNDATTKEEVKAALPPDVAEEPETPEVKSAENEEELPISDMDKSVNELVMGKGDGQYNIMVVIENGVITEAGMEMEIEQALAFSAMKQDFESQIADLKTKLQDAQAKLIQPIAKPDFGHSQVKQNFTKEDFAKMTPYERMATQKGLRVITAK